MKIYNVEVLDSGLKNENPVQLKELFEYSDVDKVPVPATNPYELFAENPGHTESLKFFRNRKYGFWRSLQRKK